MLYSNLVLLLLLVSWVRCAPSNKTTHDDPTPLAVKPPATKTTVTPGTTKPPTIRSPTSEKLIPLKDIEKKPKSSIVSATQKPATTIQQPDLVQVVPEPRESSPSLTKFQPDCADPHNKEVACSVHKVSCDTVLFEKVPVGSEPPEAHDFRLNGFAKSLARRNGEHQLHVDISWQMPPKNDSSNLKAFKLEVINQANIRQKNCFVFNVTNFGLNEHSSSPRFHFSSDSLFDFDTDYIVNLYSFPQSDKKIVVTQMKRMPKNPDTYFSDPANITQYCKTHSNPMASKWTGSFRQIFLNSLARVIKITFNPAPPQYCFEEYELRLLDSTGIELLHVASVRTEDLITKEITENNVTRNITYGEFNFTEVDLDVDYIPSILPVRYAADGRCLCPTTENHGACSCISADWKKIRLHKVDPSAVAAEPEPTPVAVAPEPEKSYAYLIVVIILSIIFLIVAVSFFVMWRWYHTRGKLITLKFVSDINGMGGASAEPVRAPLIYKKNISIFLVYAHDCPLHENVVIAFADLLKEVFGFDVHLDVWDTDDIDRNLPEYINGSIVRADKILVINSMGAFYRDRARNLKEDPIERTQGSRLDNIFMRQIDLAMQHARVLSMRFSYTPSNYTLFGLTPMLLYTVPDNLGLLVASLNDCTTANDPRLNGYSPELSRLHAAITRMASFVQSDPKWFEKFHHRVPPLPIAMSIPSGSMDSGVVSNTEEIVLPQTPQLAVHRPKDLPSSPRAIQPSAVVVTSPMGDENEPLLEEQTPETEHMLPVIPEVIPMTDFSGEGSESAYYTEEVTNDHEEELVQDKPRISALPQDEAKSRHFGGDPNADSGLHSMEVSS